MAGYLSGSDNKRYLQEHRNVTTAVTSLRIFSKLLVCLLIIGRDFTAADNKPGRGRVVILGNEIWKRDSIGDPDIVGQTVRVNSKPATIIGVHAAEF